MAIPPPLMSCKSTIISSGEYPRAPPSAIAHTKTSEGERSDTGKMPDRHPHQRMVVMISSAMRGVRMSTSIPTMRFAGLIFSAYTVFVGYFIHPVVELLFVRHILQLCFPLVLVFSARISASPITSAGRISAVPPVTSAGRVTVPHISAPACRRRTLLFIAGIVFGFVPDLESGRHFIISFIVEFVVTRNVSFALGLHVECVVVKVVVIPGSPVVSEILIHKTFFC